MEVTTSLKGTTIRSTEESPDMYASIDAVADRLVSEQQTLQITRFCLVFGGAGSCRLFQLTPSLLQSRKLRKYKERRLQGYHGGGHMGDDLALALEDVFDAEETPAAEVEAVSDDMEDPYAPQVTKVKNFDLTKPVSLQEAIFALDYLDHDFYVFRDEESDQVSVVYKRNAGGIGLIQPQ